MVIDSNKSLLFVIGIAAYDDSLKLRIMYATRDLCSEEVKDLYFSDLNTVAEKETR